jgi:tetratricopeptide (TPR) repeat protein
MTLQRYTLQWGQEFLNEEKANDAIYYFKKALKFKQDSDFLLNELALSFDLADKNEEAINFFEKYIDESPYSFYAWFNYGVCLSKKQEFIKAIEAYDYCIAIKEDFSSAYFNKGNALANLTRYEEAIDVYQETFAYEDPDPSAYFYIGECYENLEKL